MNRKEFIFEVFFFFKLRTRKVQKSPARAVQFVYSTPVTAGKLNANVNANMLMCLLGTLPPHS